MKASMTRIRQGLHRLLKDDRGAEGLEKLLIIGAIVLPLLGVLLIFRERIVEMLRSRWEDVEGDLDTPPQL